MALVPWILINTLSTTLSKIECIDQKRAMEKRHMHIGTHKMKVAPVAQLTSQIETYVSTLNSEGKYLTV